MKNEKIDKILDFLTFKDVEELGKEIVGSMNNNIIHFEEKFPIPVLISNRKNLSEYSLYINEICNKHNMTLDDFQQLESKIIIEHYRKGEPLKF